MKFFIKERLKSNCFIYFPNVDKFVIKQAGVCVNLQSKYSLDLTQFEKEGEKGIKKNRQKMNRIILIGNGFDLAKKQREPMPQAE